MNKDQLSMLIESAKSSSLNSYSPYSKFKVGASVLTKNGNYYSACNVENASYGLTSCAERNAIFKMISEEKNGEILAVCVYTPTLKPTPPCGACRQVINEFGPDSFVISTCDTEERIECDLIELLPSAFGPKNL